MIQKADERFVDDLILGLWAAVTLLGSARNCSDIANTMVLLSKAETILSAIIPRMARRVLFDLSASTPRTLQ
jgi:hypothetical protein